MDNADQMLELTYRKDDEGGGGGELTDGRGSKPIKFDRYFSGDDDIGLELDHVNWLKTKCIHLENLMENRIYDWFDSLLEDYVNALMVQNGNNSVIKKILDPNNPSIEYGLVIPEIIAIIRSMVSFVLYVHSKELVFKSTLHANYHFGVSEGVLKFWRIRFDKSNNHRKRQRDFRQIEKIIRSSVLQLGEAKLEVYMDDLLKLMKSDYPKHMSAASAYSSDSDHAKAEYEDYFKVHMALMSHAQRTVYIKNCIDKAEGLGIYGRMVYNNAIVLMGYNNHNWIDNLRGSFSRVKYSLEHQLAKKADPSSQGRFHKYLDMETFIAQLRGVYSDQVVNNRSYHPVNKAILSICRNLVTHLHNDVSGTIADKNVDDEWIDGPIMHLFENQLLAFQRALFEKQILDYFMI